MGVSHRLHVDCSERNAALLKLASECGDFEVIVVRLRSGDYLVDDCVLVERKTCADFATSLVDGTYLISAQAYDSFGVSGAPRSLSITLNRYAPGMPTGFEAGRNGSVVDLQWTAQPQRQRAPGGF